MRLALIWALLCAAAFGAAAAEQASLLAAAKSGAAAEVRKLLKGGANPNEADADGTSALHWAVHRGAADTVRALLRAAQPSMRRIATASVPRTSPRRMATPQRCACCSKRAPTCTAFSRKAKRC